MAIWKTCHALDGESLYELVEQESVDSMLGVPTVWLGLLQYLEGKGLKLDTVDQVLVGGCVRVIECTQIICQCI